jgi:N-acetylglucosaminyl-diphospho-decaprenol L-rhamnosyltransferase
VSRVLVAVVTYNSATELPHLVASLPDGMSGVDDWRLVVADNASSDGSADLVGELAPSATVIQTGANLGYAAGINACMALAEPDEDLFVLNADVRLGRGCVRALVDACADGVTGVAAPVVQGLDGTVEASLRRRPTALRTVAESFAGVHAGRFGEQLDVPSSKRSLAVDADWINGAVLFVPAAVRARIGPWQQDLFLYSEEVDYCRRVIDAGWRVRWIPTARATHRGGEATSSPALWAQLTTNKVVHLARWEGRRHAAVAWVGLLAAQAIRLPLRRGTHQRALVELWSGRRSLLAGIPTNPAAPREFRVRIPVSGAIGGRV